MTYQDARKYIEEKNKLGIRPGLSLMKELLSRMGNPEQGVRILHIAGTNGKGSVFTFCEFAMLAAGLTVGRYVSPAVTDELESFTVNRVKMSREDYASYMEYAARCVSEMEACGLDSPTSFEIETAIAYKYFNDKNVDYALVECGMGGAEDATNAAENTEISVMAQISMDHMQFLGDTLAEIARTKAGIVKSGGVLVSAPQEEAADRELRLRCKMMGARYIPVGKETIRIKEKTLKGTTFIYDGNEYRIALLGDHQVINAATAIEVLKLLPQVRREHIEAGLAEASWPGRLTCLFEKPYIFADGAHNKAAWNVLADSVNYYFTNRKKIYIIGVFRDKEYEEMVRILGPTADHVITITPPTARGLPAKELAACFEKAGISAEAAEDPAQALSRAKALASREDAIIISGSLSFLKSFLSGATGNE